MTIHLTPADYGAILPEMIVIGGALLLLLLDVFVKQRKVLVNTTAALLTLAGAFVASAHLWVINAGVGLSQGA